MSNFTDLSELPQEIVYEIFMFVPEYGHGVCQELHELSLYSNRVSAYCDLRRYCARSITDILDTCLELLTSPEAGKFKVDIIHYMQKHIRDLLYRYLDEWNSWICNTTIHDIIIRDILTRFGIHNVQKLSTMSHIEYKYLRISSNTVRWRKQYIDFYVTMILFESKMITKKEFDRYTSKMPNLRAILQYIINEHPCKMHICKLAARYFRDIIPQLCAEPDMLRAANYGRLYDRFIEMMNSLAISE